MSKFFLAIAAGAWLTGGAGYCAWQELKGSARMCRRNKPEETQ